MATPMKRFLNPEDVPKLGKIPRSLRWGLAWGILRGEFLTISMSAGEHGIQYLFVVQPKTVRRWVEQTKARRAAEREAKDV